MFALLPRYRNDVVHGLTPSTALRVALWPTSRIKHLLRYSDREIPEASRTARHGFRTCRSRVPPLPPPSIRMGSGAPSRRRATLRSDERSVGKECVSRFGSRGLRAH